LDGALMLNPGAYADFLEFLGFQMEDVPWVVGAFSRTDKYVAHLWAFTRTSLIRQLARG
jgi:hypothetical protein